MPAYLWFSPMPLFFSVQAVLCVCNLCNHSIATYADRSTPTGTYATEYPQY